MESAGTGRERVSCDGFYYDLKPYLQLFLYQKFAETAWLRMVYLFN